MNSKERVLAAINHEIPDRVPLDIWATDVVQKALCRHFGVSDFEQVREKFGIDIRSVWPQEEPWPLLDEEQQIWEDPWGIHWQILAGLLQPISHPMADLQTVAEVEAYPAPAFDLFDFEGMRAQCQSWSEYALMIRDPGPYATCVLRVAMFLRGMEQFMMDMIINPDFAHALIAKIEAYYLEFNRRILESVSDLVDIYFIADDTGTETSLMMSPQMIREYVHPSLRKFTEQSHQHGLKVMYHNEGAIRPLIPDYLDMGIDILNPIQVRLPGMAPNELKTEFGDRLAFHGGVELTVLSPVTEGTPSRVRAEVKRLIDSLGREGGYILAPVNLITPDEPLDRTVANVVAMYETAHEYGWYDR